MNFELADSFNIASRYQVYADLKAEARFLRLSGDGLFTVSSKFAEVGVVQVESSFNPW